MTEQRIFKVELIVRQRRTYTLSEQDMDGAQDAAFTDAQAMAGLHDVEGGSVKVEVEDVRIHDFRDVTADYRDRDPVRQ